MGRKMLADGELDKAVAAEEATETHYDFDLFVIGAGSGGVRAARFSANNGAKVGICELPFHPISSEEIGGVGGTCVIRGCVPKKILVYGATYGGELEDARNYGWEINENVDFTWKKLLQKKTDEILRLNNIYKRLLANAAVKLYEGEGRIVGPNEVEVRQIDGTKISYTAKHILIATGSRAQKPNIPGHELAITSDEALSLEEFPKRAVVLGGGYIAVEFASIWRGMGGTVDLFFRKELPHVTSRLAFLTIPLFLFVGAKTRLGMESNPSVHEVLNTFDTLSEILLLLPPEETYKLILVSKRWLQIISSPFFRHAYLARWKPNFHLIGFFISNTSYVGKKHVERVRRPRSESSMPLLSTSSLGDEVETSGALKKLGYYIDSSNGVLLCGRHPKAYYLWDPVTRKQHKIPRHRVHFEEVCMSLITEDCPVEGFSYKVVRGECVSYAAHSNKVRVEIYSSKTTTWSYSELVCNEAVSLTPWTAGRVIKGVVYWHATGGKVAIYDTEDEEKKIDVIKLPKTFNYDEQVLGESSDGCLQYGWSNKSVMEIWKLEKVGEVLEWSIQFKVNFKAMWRLNPVESARFSTRTKETQLLAFFNQNSDSVFIRCDSHICVFDTKTQRVEEVQYQGRGSSFVWDYCKVLPYFQLSWPCSSSSLLEEGNI